MSKVCLTLAETSLSSLEEKIAVYCSRVDLIEVRLDYLASPAIPRPPEGARAELLATCRPLREGGKFEESEAKRLDLLRRAAEGGFDWVDLEWDAGSVPLPAKTRVVRSLHLFDRFPPDLDGTLGRLAASGGDVLKLAFRVSNTREAVRLLKWMDALPRERPRVIIGMALWGQLTRLLGGFLGNSWTYVTEEEKAAVAPGQFGLSSALDLYRLGRWGDAAPRLYGVLANPVGHSLSPLLHNSLFRCYEIEGLYVPVQLDDLDAWFDFLETTSLPFFGFSVTIPFKTEVNRFLARSDSPVEAVNTLVREDSGWVGSNTDRIGFLRPIQSRIDRLEGRSALILGNGGVAHSVADILSEEKLQVTVAGRNRGRLDAFARRHGCSTILLEDLPFEADLCVNTTPIGQFPATDASPLSGEEIQFKWVYDLIYNPERTKLIQMAESRGVKTISGLEMFIEQGAEQFLQWTGIDPDREQMRSILQSASSAVS